MKYEMLNIWIKDEHYIEIELYDGHRQRLTYMRYNVPETHIKEVHSALIDSLSRSEKDTLDQWDMNIHKCIEKTLGWR
jgi:hypothetical protein